MRRFRVAAAAAAVAVAALAAACGADDEPTVQPGTTAAPRDSTAADEFNDADVDFARAMIEHHEQAIDMADLVIAKGQDGGVRGLAERIKDQQGPEIRRMQDWLASWGIDSGGGSGVEHGTASPMMTDEDMAALEGVSGASLDRMFLEMMIEHHRGAVEIAEQEAADGVAAEAVDLARDIIEAQTAEIAAMEILLEER